MLTRHRTFITGRERFRRGAAVRRIVGCGAAVSAVIMAAGCGSGSASAGRGSVTASFSAVILSVGNSTDGAFGQAQAQAARAATRGNVRVQFVGNVNTPDQYASEGSSYASAGYNLILIANGGMQPIAVELAKHFPKSRFGLFAIPSGQLNGLPPNLFIYYTNPELGGFRAGILAGLVTRSDVLGSNQSLVFPGVTAQVEGFQLGAECVNSGVSVMNVVTNNDTDPSPTETASLAQIARGADVLFGATGTAMPGMFEAAKQHPGVFAIAQYVNSASAAPTAVIASAIQNFAQATVTVVSRSTRGMPPQIDAFGNDIGVGQLTVNPLLYNKLSAKVQAENAAVQAAVTSGSIRIPPLSDVGTPGSASRINVRSLGCRPVR